MVGSLLCCCKKSTGSELKRLESHAMSRNTSYQLHHHLCGGKYFLTLFRLLGQLHGEQESNWQNHLYLMKNNREAKQRRPSKRWSFEGILVPPPKKADKKLGDPLTRRSFHTEQQNGMPVSLLRIQKLPFPSQWQMTDVTFNAVGPAWHVLRIE